MLLSLLLLLLLMPCCCCCFSCWFSSWIFYTLFSLSFLCRQKHWSETWYWPNWLTSRRIYGQTIKCEKKNSVEAVKSWKPHLNLKWDWKYDCFRLTLKLVRAPSSNHLTFFFSTNVLTVEGTRPDTRHKMRLVRVLLTFEKNPGRTDGRTDRRTRLHIEMRRRI